MVQYKYDAWGNHAVLDANGADINDASHIGNLNPFRYRGYYYDTETGLYYLKSRYYDPETGRFITIDDISYLDPETINGLNLYAYCGNNPVMRVDENGNAWWDWLFGIVIIVAAVALSVVTSGLITAAFGAVMGTTLIGSVIGGAAAGLVSGAISAFGFSVGTQAISQGFANINWGQVGIDVLMGAYSGAIAGGAIGGLKYIVNVKNLAAGLSGLNKAQARFNNAEMVLKNTPLTVKGGVLSTERIVALLSYDAASIDLAIAEHANWFIKKGLDLVFSLIKSGFSKLISDSYKI